MRRAAILMLMQSSRHHEEAEAAETHEAHEHKMTKDTAEKWVSHMRTADGKSVSPPWTMEQASQVLHQRNWNCDPVDFWAIMVALWSDHCAVARKYGVDNVDFWADMAKSWLDDPDAEPDKVWRYYKYVTKR